MNFKKFKTRGYIKLENKTILKSKCSKGYLDNLVKAERDQQMIYKKFYKIKKKTHFF